MRTNDADPAVDTDLAVDTRNLTKRYRRRTVVAGVDLRLPAGAVTGLVGPNGAGKTTIMAMLLGLVRPDAGGGTVLGAPLHRPAEYLPRVGAIIEGPAFHPGLDGHTNLTQLAVLGGHDPRRIGEVLDLTGLTGRARDRVGAYSLGMKQRLGIAAALLGDPDLVVLDEPANGLDPVGMRDLRRIISTIRDQGRTVLLSSHLLGELEQVSDHLVVLDRGGLVHEGPPRSMPRSPREAIEVVPHAVADLPGLDLALREDGLTPAPGDGRNGAFGPGTPAVLLPTRHRDPAEVGAAAARSAARAGIPLSALIPQHTDLESRYLELVSTTEENR